jgi:hypothetical protein
MLPDKELHYLWHGKNEEHGGGRSKEGGLWIAHSIDQSADARWQQKQAGSTGRAVRIGNQRPEKKRGMFTCVRAL